MGPLADEVRHDTELELSRLIGYRLMGWSIISLWAAVVVILFRVVKTYPPELDNWLLWVGPLLVVRSISGVVLHRILEASVNIPRPEVLARVSALYSLFDGIVLLSAVVILYDTGGASVHTLVFTMTAVLALNSLVYLFTPWVCNVQAGVAILPATALALFYGIPLPWELVIPGLFVLVATFLGARRFSGLFLGQMESKFAHMYEMRETAETNFIFNEHWQNMRPASVDWDRDCVIKSWNPAAEKLFGVSSEDARDKSLELLFDRETAAQIRSEWIQATANPIHQPALRTITRSGQDVVTCWYDTPLFHAGELIGVASIVIDLSEVLVSGRDRASSTVVDRVSNLSVAKRTRQNNLDQAVASGAVAQLTTPAG